MLFVLRCDPAGHTGDVYVPDLGAYEPGAIVETDDEELVARLRATGQFVGVVASEGGTGADVADEKPKRAARATSNQE